MIVQLSEGQQTNLLPYFNHASSTLTLLSPLEKKLRFGAAFTGIKLHNLEIPVNFVFCSMFRQILQCMKTQEIDPLHCMKQDLGVRKRIGLQLWLQSLCSKIAKLSILVHVCSKYIRHCPGYFTPF